MNLEISIIVLPCHVFFSVRRYYRYTLHWRNAQPHQLRLLHQLPVVRRHHRRPAVPPLEEAQLVPTHQGTPGEVYKLYCSRPPEAGGVHMFMMLTIGSTWWAFSLWLLRIIILNYPISRRVPKSKVKFLKHILICTMNYGIKNWFVEIVKLCSGLMWFLPATTFMQRLRYGNGWINHDVANIYQLFPPLKKSPVDPAWKQQQVCVERPGGSSEISSAREASLTGHSHFVGRVWTQRTLRWPQHFSSLQLLTTSTSTLLQPGHSLQPVWPLLSANTSVVSKQNDAHKVGPVLCVVLHSTATLRFTMT